MRLFVKLLEEKDPGWYSRASNFVPEPVVGVQISGLSVEVLAKPNSLKRPSMASPTKSKPSPSPSSEPPPSKIHVQKFSESRAAELESLHSVVATRLGGDFRSDRSKRRRTTAFDSKAAGRRRKVRRRNSFAATNIDKKTNAGDGGDEQVRVCRRARRREELKMKLETGFSTSGDGTRWLRTHVWHAKRFAMTKLWGYYLPLALHGRGKGSRALLKQFRDGVVIHDSSYHVAVQLEGPQDSLLSILSTVLGPSLFDGSCDNDSIISGATFGNAMLHRVGALCTEPIGPVRYMWQPCCRPKMIDGVDSVKDEPESKESHFDTRKVWVWIHASAFNEGYEALKFACQKEMDERGVLINCFSLEGQLAKLEVMGSKSFQLLQRTLTLAGISECSSVIGKHSVGEVDNDSQYKNIPLLDNGVHISAKSVLSLCVMDPRRMTEKRKILNFQDSTSGDMVVDIPQNEVIEHTDLPEISDRNKESFSFWSETTGNSTLSCRSLWDLSSGVIPPVEETVLCNERHEMRKRFYCLDHPISTEVQSSRCCPIMLLKNENKKGLSIGWSIILHLSWVKAFWVPLVSNGAHAIGLKEKHWVSCEAGLPCFPSDFPDCNAYSCLKASEANASDLNWELRPSSLRPLKVPIPPPWNCVQFSLNRILKREENSKIFSEEKQDNVNSTSDSKHADHRNSLDGFVARTSCSLMKFLNEVDGDHLLLFPQVAGRNAYFPEIAKDEPMLSWAQNGVVTIKNNCKLCFVRVLLHAYKEGSFEEDAVVCAPRLSDIKLWTSSLESNEDGLQITQSAVGTYFKEQSSGQWELQISEDSESSGPFRFPIGFVTTGFVRGSMRLVAEACCEAVLLSHLRNKQWSDFPVTRRRKEIFVLVRNLRSTAYRLALATIVLEHQEDDLDYF